NLIRQVTHQNQILFRPPFCKKLIGLPRYLHQHHRLTITWDVEPDSRADLRKSATRLAAYTIDHTRPGSIILLHSMNPTEWPSRQALKELITGLKAKGYSFVTVSQLLQYSR
ncbi:MAG: polysaccharide deacetylase, partial [Spirosoma sp.]|nr:polysaccharide deacetylase [Spirosoma sp.]